MNKKRILILITAFIIILVLFLFILNNKFNKKDTIITSNISNFKENVIFGNELLVASSENIILDEVIFETTDTEETATEENTEIESNIETTIIPDVASEDSISTNQNETKKTATTVSKETTKSQETPVSSPIDTTPSQTVTVQIEDTPAPVEVPSTPILTEPATQEDSSFTEQYIPLASKVNQNQTERKTVVNNGMINKLKQTIQENATSKMKEQGYNIVVDSNITKSCHGFTYSLFNINNALINRSGTIRIYADDYYYNGEFVETRCYIL